MKEGTVDNKNIRNINVEKIKKDKKDNLRLEHSPSADYNHQIFKRKHNAYLNFIFFTIILFKYNFKNFQFLNNKIFFPS